MNHATIRPATLLTPTNALRNLTHRTNISRPGYNFSAVVNPLEYQTKMEHHCLKMFLHNITNQLLRVVHLSLNGVGQLHLIHHILKARLQHSMLHETGRSVLEKCMARRLSLRCSQ